MHVTERIKPVAAEATHVREAPRRVWRSVQTPAVGTCPRHARSDRSTAIVCAAENPLFQAKKQGRHLPTLFDLADPRCADQAAIARIRAVRRLLWRAALFL